MLLNLDIFISKLINKCQINIHNVYFFFIARVQQNFVLLLSEHFYYSRLFVFLKILSLSFPQLLYNLAVTTAEAVPTDSPNSKPDRSDNKRKTSRTKTDKAKAETGPKAVVLATPYVNISDTGTVPREPTTFTLHLPCTGAESGEVEVTLNINVTSPRPNLQPTKLFFRRKKICLKGTLTLFTGEMSLSPSLLHSISWEKCRENLCVLQILCYFNFCL